MATKYNVFRPSNRVLRAAGGSRSSGGFGSGGASGYDTFINAITQIRDDRNNREILLGHGHTKEIVDKMSSAQLATTVADYARDDVERDKIKRADELIGTSTDLFLANLAGFNQAEMAKKPIEALGDLFAPDRLGRVGRPDIRPRDIEELPDPTDYSEPYGVNWGPGYGEPGQPPIGIDLEKETVPRGPAIPEFDPISKKAISPPPDYTPTSKNILQALARHPASMLEPLDQSGILNKALDHAYRLDAEASKERVIASKPTHTSRLNEFTGKTERGFTDPGTNVFTPSVTIDDKGNVVRVLVAPTRTITQDNVGPATRDALKYHQDKINQNITFIQRYSAIKSNFDANFFTTWGRLKQQFTTIIDGKFMLNPRMKFAKTPEGRQFRRAVALMQSARQLFIEERRASTGVAFSEKEIEQLNKTNLNVDDYGPEQVMATLDGKVFGLNNQIDLNQNFMKNFNNTSNLFDLNVLQREYAEDVGNRIFDPEPNKPGGSGRLQLKTQMNKAKGGKK
jgi:hypothetical protein